jgi:hypothetical protein
MDINYCINRLNLNANFYELTQSVPPHSITNWEGPDPQPTEEELRPWRVLCRNDGLPSSSP